MTRTHLPLLLATSVALASGCGSDDTGDSAADTSTGSSPGSTSTAGSTGSSGSTSEADSSEGGSTAAPGSTGGSSSGEPTTGGLEEDLDMTPDDFICLLEWDQVRRFRITNLLGYVDQTLEVANSPTGGTYPVGTVIQLIPNEAMVKRGTGWAPETNDWEFFSLDTSAAGTEILDRGTTEVINQFGGNCFSCHAKAEPQWDLICEQDHGCMPLQIDEATILALQEGDPRCR